MAEDKPFQFKQFTVNQAGCAMKVNTDGVLLGALAGTGNPQTVLDIGTGTGVVALMLAQRFPGARIDAVEIEEQAAQTAGANFKISPFHERLNVYAQSFQEFSKQHPNKKYDLIAANPPFFINALKSRNKQKETARHAESSFFEDLASFASAHLISGGTLALILPLQAASVAVNYAREYKLFPHRQIEIASFRHQLPHRFIIHIGFKEDLFQTETFNIYQEPGRYSEEYEKLLSGFLTIF